MTGLTVLILAGASLTAVIIVVPLFMKLRAHLGGASEMTDAYDRRRKLDGHQTWRSVSPLFFGPVGQRHLWTIAIDDFGMHLVPQAPFLPVQRGLSVPFDDIACRRVWADSMMYVEFNFADAPTSSVRVDERQAFSILAASGGRLTFVDSRAVPYSELLRRRQLRGVGRDDRVDATAE